MLDNDDLVLLLQKCKTGDDSAFSELVHHYNPLIYSLISAYSMEESECYSEACMSLYKAARSFNCEQDAVTFGLYARICISRRLSDLARASGRDEDRLSDMDVDSIAVPGGIDARLVAMEERLEFRSRAGSLLSDYEYKVLLMWLEGYKTAAIASMLGTESKSVDNAKGRIMKKLRDGLPPPRA